MSYKLKIFGLTFILSFLFFGIKTYATTTLIAKKVPEFEISGWIPYWRAATGTAEAINHIGVFTEISPFGFTVKHDGTLFDAMKINEAPWTDMIAVAKVNNVKVIPTVMWGNSSDIYTVLKSPSKRKAHIQSIVDAVYAGNFDGIDIDYEAKTFATKRYFSLFLHDLYYAIGKKIVSCTIEARTPLHDRFNVIPKDIQYANDFVAINKYCDRVRIMTYDQGAADLILNETTTSPYIPVADPKWVEKVVNLAAKTISKKKIVIGIATYGYEYTVTPTTGGYVYDRETSFNPKYAYNIAEAFGGVPLRNIAGELSFTYMPTSTPVTPVSLINPSNTPSLDTSTFGQNPITSSTGGNLYATSTTQSFRLLWWSDAQAIKDKIDLAKKLGVRGVALFKIDGGADPAIWDVLKK